MVAVGGVVAEAEADQTGSDTGIVAAAAAAVANTPSGNVVHWWRGDELDYRSTLDGKLGSCRVATSFAQAQNTLLPGGHVACPDDLKSGPPYQRSFRYQLNPSFNGVRQPPR